MNDANPGSLTLPLIIARSFVVFPSSSEEIQAGRDISRRAVEEAKQATNNLLFVVSQKDEKVDDPKAEDLYDVGTLCRVTNCVETGEGYRIRIVGSKRVRFKNIAWNEGYFVAVGDPIEPVFSDKGEEMRLVKELNSLLSGPDSVLPRVNVISLTKGINSEDLPDTIAPFLNLSIPQKQALLAESDVNKRLSLTIGYINSAKEMAAVEDNISKKVQESAQRNQKEYILREKMKAIREELGEGNDEEHSEDAILKKLEENPYPEAIKAKVKNELRRYRMMPESSIEASLIMNYIDTIFSIPWFEKTEDDEDLKHVQQVLDEDHYGLEKVKKRIIEYLAVKKMTGTLKAPILCFYGPPGCGKTSLGRSIARALGRKFFKTALGGISDEAEIRGHRRTYVGSLPGRIIHGMIKAGTVNPVFLLDEIDKLGGSSYRGDPSSALLEVLDPEQNFAFNDNFVEEPYDLSNVLFICTANNLDNIPGPLRDRLELIEVPSYTEIEKIKIAKGFLIPKQTKLAGLKEEDIAFDDDSLKCLIEHYTMEAGVRQLERLVASCCRKAVVEILNNPDSEKPIRIGVDKVHEYQGVEIFEGTKKEKENQVGVVTGLAYTDFGGDILPIEVNYFPGKGGLILTGKLGEVMKESATIALDYVRANSKKYGIDDKIFAESDIHVHVPEGAVPKDGPSAGVAITTAIISCLTHTPVDANVAMTGEVTLRGNALPIGGLREKSLAAARSGIKRILVPIDNKKDVEELPEEVKKSLQISFMKTVDDALAFALVGKKA